MESNIKIGRCLIRLLLALLCFVLPKESVASDNVGTVSGAFEVSPTGAAVYSIPFDIYPSGTGFEPKIGLQYNSQMEGYGNAGYGASISGISVITRGGKELYHDKTVQKVTYQAGDSYSLDGKRLVLKSGEEGMDGAVYTVEGTPYVTVTLHESDLGKRSYTWFEVNNTDGSTVEYQPKVFNDKARNAGSNCAIAWYISKVTNKYNDYLDYHYITFDNVVYPSFVVYAHGSETHYVTFSYSNLAHPKPFVMEGGVHGKISRRLSAVTSYHNSNDIYRTYRLNYDTESDGSERKCDRLVSVSVENEEGESLAPLQLRWKPLESASAERKTVAIETKERYYEDNTGSFLSMDLNGDGYGDIIRICNGRYFSNTSIRCTYVNIYFTVVSEDGTLSYSTPARYTMDASYDTGKMSSILKGIRTFDCDGDGLTDLLIPSYGKSQYDSNATLTFNMISGKKLKDGRGDLSAENFILFGLGLASKGDKAHVVTLDVNCDGRDEIIYVEDTQVNGIYNGKIVSNIKIETGYTNSTTPLSFRYTSGGRLKRVFLADCNADRLQDLLLLYDNGYKIYYNNGTEDLGRCFTESSSQEFVGADLRDCKIVEQGDFNGDELIDFLSSVTEDGKLYLRLNNGDGTFATKVTSDFGIYDQGGTDKDNNDLTIAVFDADRDGMSDVIIAKSMFRYHSGSWFEHSYYRYENGEGTTYIKWLSSTGDNLVPFGEYEKKNREYDASPWNIFVGDLDGDGYPELANFGAPLDSNSDSFQDNQLFIYKFPTEIKLGKVCSISDGYGRKTDIAYENGTSKNIDIHNNSFYRDWLTYDRRTYDKYGVGRLRQTTESEEMFPVAEYRLPVALVSSVAQTNGAAGVQRKNFYYPAMKVHLQGRGSLGFNTLLAEDVTLGTKTLTAVKEWDKGLWIPKCVQTITALGGNNSYELAFNTSISTIIKDTSWNGNYFAYPSETVSKDYDGNYTSVTHRYDTSKGVPTEECSSYDLCMDTYSQTLYDNYVQTSGMCKPTVVRTIKKHADDANTHTVTCNYTYDKYGEVTKEKTVSSYNGNNVTLTTSYTRNEYGNVLTELTSGTRVKKVTKKYTYDSDGLRLIRSYTSPLLTDVYYEYDKWGRVVSKCDKTEIAHGLTTRYTYDNWGTLTSTTYPDGSETSTETSWDSSVPNAVYKVTTRQTGAPAVSKIYDSEGRELLSATTVGPQNITSSTSSSYNKYGTIDHAINTTGRLTLTSTSEYDYRGRVIRERHSDGTETAYTYDNRTITTASPTGVRVSTYDVAGNIQNVSDNASEVFYHYSSVGKPSLITAGNSTVQIEYDGAGRRISLSELDSGTQTYSYAADGTLLSQTDANGNTISFVYDTKGRLSRRLGGDGDETVTYGSAGTTRNRIWGRQTDTGFSENYTYDTFGRVTSISRQMDSWGTYNKSFEYDSRGRKVKASYPGDVVVRYEYDDFGNMTNIIIKDSYDSDFNVLDTWKYDGLNRVSFFGDISCTDSYYPTTGRLACRTLDVLEDEELERINYIYDDVTGNITNRWFGCAEGKSKNNMSGVMLPPMDSRLYRVESFTYDNSDRLTSFSVAGPDVADTQSHSFRYDEDGNITYKSNIGSYGYSEDKPHAVYAIYSPEQEMTAGEQSVVYNRDGKCEMILQRKNGGANVLINYFGLDQEKWVSVQNIAGKKNPLEIVYFDDYEKITEGNDVTEQYFLENDVILIKQNGVLSQYKAFKDVLGSILVVVDKSGNHVFEATYDAWGKQTVTLNSIGFRYGYGGHEMLPDFEVIDMGGRVYDPALGRFLSCDNFVQEPTNSQNFNRYTYCLNNPLRYNDPSGEIAIETVVGVAIVVGGGVINAVVNAPDINSLGQACGYFGVGASSSLTAMLGGVAGIVGGGVLLGGGNSIVEQGFTNINWSKVGCSAIVGGITSYASSFIGTRVTAFTNGWFRSISNIPLRETFSGIVGGIVSGGIVGAAFYYVNGKEGSLWGNVGKGALQWGLIGGIGGFAKGRIESKDLRQKELVGNSNIQQVKERTIQNHHFATNKNKRFTPQIKSITDKYNLNLDDNWNKEMLPHQGKHPNFYHEWVIDRLNMIDHISDGEQRIFLENFEKYIKQPVRNNPEMLYKNYWLSK